MDNCYLCGNEFDTDKVLRHDEHILQQAIGGALSNKNILCLTCGEYLGRDVDVPFNEIFHGIATRLDIKKDRKPNKKSTIKGALVSKSDRFGFDLSGTEVIWKDFKVTPAVPLHRYSNDNSKVIIYANKKQAKTYSKKVEIDVGTKFKDNKPEFIFCDDIDGSVLYQFKLDSDAFKKGLAKIAIGFASSIGISRNEMPLALKVKPDNRAEIKSNIKLLQYFPLGEIYSNLESLSSEIGYFPTHTLIIFTAASDPSKLVCYIELFSTFQWYVILNDNYQGDAVYEYHYQRLLKTDDYIFEPGRHYYKERSQTLAYLGISKDRIHNAYEKQKDSKDAKTIESVEIEIVKEEYIKKKYRVEFEQEIERGLSVMTTNIIKQGLNSFKNPMDLKMNIELFYDYQGDDEIFNISSYKRCYTQDFQNRDYISSLMDSFQSLSDSGELQKYSYSKFNKLSEFIEVEGIKKKLA